jgi:hypothetical protein
MLRKLIVIMVGLALLGGFAAAKADGELVLRVTTDAFMDFDSTIGGTTAKGGAAFHVSGDICVEPDLGSACTPMGKFHCWGWLIGPLQLVGPVSQEYNLFGRGKIQVQGIEDDGPRAVVGGTGDFRMVRGEATGFDLSEFGDSGEFIATFKLIGAKRKK